MPHHFLPRLSLLALAIAHLGLAPALISRPAHATEPASATLQRSYDIPAGPLEAALNRFGRETGILLSFSTNLTTGLQSPGLQGSHAIDSGLAHLLQGTGLAAEARGDGSYTLYKLPAASGDVTLTPVTVRASAEQERAWGPVQGYVARRSATGTKTDTPIIETPQSISVVGAEEVETRKASNLMDALSYVAGVARSEGADRTGEYFVIRGFRAYSGVGSIYRDGTKYTVNGFNGQQELYGLERIELLKGASSVLYGTAAPGGIINTVSKRPPGASHSTQLIMHDFHASSQRP